MILGIGNDVIEIRRIRAALARRGDAFLERVLAPEERRRARAISDAARLAEFVAGRFAAKEAIAKAAGCGLARLSMPNVAVSLGDAGLQVVWQPSSALWAQFGPPDAARVRLHLALTHSGGLAFAVAVLEQL
ncbi:holo-ACP synthase [Alicyclobacillus mali]|uniref:Holo-[acyl-carrier-protein] synthase n=1 Tax=Alicyclobacillus mali (ex Roth et al. 2021) TaxID=1123961 RepID=A0ABS0F4C1_9BACL|nr:holo-ACP synthase [Alicyclobacillus mali (ex Roth et al. 2021)]MBF8378147.1 holo-ACP synthase [Alicyclobacillus mali (ex Roth et al. 2021)]MCL6487767.1 holo-ACP synthase [Alicyclobacillus mali (ex Roth et al. 2021)]